MELLEGVTVKPREKDRKGEERMGSKEEQEGIRREEVEEVIKEMKEKKAAGTDGLPNEVWIYGGERLKEKIWEVCDTAWRTEEIAEDWKEGIIVPIVKKGEGKETQDYRGVTLMNTNYKIYAAILPKRLEKEAEERRILP
ncbi:uncharacterized protein [Temnothorax nylanderi]|uniref:uncharacterized protein n=1 Tax=Temnothorax nylanderi TaxID=102681 RepID=UPI003A89F8E5